MRAVLKLFKLIHFENYLIIDHSAFSEEIETDKIRY